MRLAVTDCFVDCPGDVRDADIGASYGNGKRQTFVKGQIVARARERRIVDALLEQAIKLTDSANRACMGFHFRCPGSPSHPVIPA
ncbi:flavodoxin-dependent (E)-4-hydroxy-3-methylbut-2-enyl-diphosphate synthase [Streptomyces sp. NPDC048309]|uniref:flavodoxin-dependent (E)-4-hydroxy-3-methylbut-2-enyl-diphosphate synthase n=1 Tax=unclassified Streptomyces TaxID=2593676 RepID=UPI0033DAB6EE